MYIYKNVRVQLPNVKYYLGFNYQTFNVRFQLPTV